MKVKGIHHISNIVGHPQENIDFSTSFLGLRMIKKAVNFDDAYTYHFYYGNNDADVGTLITAFPYAGEVKAGVKGGGQVYSIYYIIPVGSLGFWENRLKEFKLDYEKINLFDKEHLVFTDEVGIKNELVESSAGKINNYEYNGITKEVAIKGFYGAMIHSTKPKESQEFFVNILGMKLLNEDLLGYRFELESEIGKYLDLSKIPYSSGRLSKGTVHHIALTVSDLKTLGSFKRRIEELDIKVSDIKDRDFFKSIYFREPGGTIIELATFEPGYIKEEIDDKGLELYLPDHFKDKKAELNEVLIPVFVEPTKELKKYKYSNKEEFEIQKAHQELLIKINAYAKLAKKRKLTDEEIVERDKLREQYLYNIRLSFTTLVDTIKIEEDDGTKHKIKRKKEKWNN